MQPSVREPTSRALSEALSVRATAVVRPALPYLALLRAGFGQPTCRHVAGGLLPHHFTLARTAAFAAAAGGVVSVPLSVGLRRLGITQRPALRSPDFPHRGRRTLSAFRACRPCRSTARPSSPLSFLIIPRGCNEASFLQPMPPNRQHLHPTGRPSAHQTQGPKHSRTGSSAPVW